jgi:hypothetical protein
MMRVLLLLALFGCAQTSYVVAIDPPPCKVICMHETVACEKSGQDINACYKIEEKCFDGCDRSIQDDK